MSRVRRPLLIAATSLLVTIGVFGLAEVAIRLFGGDPPEWPTSDLTGVVDGVTVDPLFGPLPQPGWRGDWINIFAVEVDAHGFRATGLPGFDSPRARVAFLGDSCTFGWRLDTADTFVAQLDQHLRSDGVGPVELLNAAYPGHSAVIGEPFLRARVLPLRPDVVVLGYSANNAFRLTALSDAARVRHIDLRNVLLHSRLFYSFAAYLARRQGITLDPRDRSIVNALPFNQLRRVAAPEEFAAAERAMVADARRAGAAVMFLIIPRASEVSTAYSGEDPVRNARAHPALSDEGPEARSLLEFSCLDPGTETELTDLRERLRQRQPVYPDDATLRALLVQGARAFASEDYAAALTTFRAAVAASPQSPLAHYDLAAAAFMSGNASAGLRHLSRAERLSCNVFLHYQAVLWRLADELHVPVVDLTLPFQAYDNAPLFLDPAHPNAAAARIIATALAPALARQLGPILAEHGQP